MDSVLINILADHLVYRQSEPFDLSGITALVKSHQVIPIVYYQMRERSLYKPYLQAISSYSRRKVLLNQIKCALTEIPFFTVKGLSVSKFYPVPQLRTMGDSDILVHESDKEKAHEMLTSIRFQQI